MPEPCQTCKGVGSLTCPALLEAEAAFPALVERILADLESYGLGFLRGDVSDFRRVRAETNRSREPYWIRTPNGDGTYRTGIDPVSAELKARFS